MRRLLRRLFRHFAELVDAIDAFIDADFWGRRK